MRTGLTKQEKTTDIWFDEKDPLIHIRTHNTDLKKRLAAYARQHPDQCRQTDTDPETGCMEFEIHKGRDVYKRQLSALVGDAYGQCAGGCEQDHNSRSGRVSALSLIHISMHHRQGIY